MMSIVESLVRYKPDENDTLKTKAQQTVCISSVIVHRNIWIQTLGKQPPHKETIFYSFRNLIFFFTLLDTAFNYSSALFWSLAGMNGF